MTTANASQKMEAFYWEEAEKKSAARWSTVFDSPHVKGREGLATKLLSVSGEHAMSAEQIIKALEKAPLPNASGTGTPPAPSEQPADDPEY